MATEIERKFLVTGDGWRDAVIDRQRIRQGYLAEAGTTSVRVRVEGTSANLNIKAAVVGSVRAEYEYPIPPADAEAMLADLCLYPPIEKTRHRVEHAGHIWEVDEFEGANAPLVVAEIELDSQDEVFEWPDWLGREVTREQAYYNHALSEQPYGDWTEHE